jgi:hypothetical protein
MPNARPPAHIRRIERDKTVSTIIIFDSPNFYFISPSDDGDRSSRHVLGRAKEAMLPLPRKEGWFSPSSAGI